MKDEDTIKQKENPKGRGSENYERNTVVIRTVLVINFKKYIQELISSNYADDDFLQIK